MTQSGRRRHHANQPATIAGGPLPSCRHTEQLGLIIRYTNLMRTISATEASRRFSDLLDAIERGESVTVTRGNRPVAEIHPARRRTGQDLRAALADVPAPDDHFESDLADALGYVTNERTDPWADA
jgi:prevent-host-death family protein